MNDLLNSNFFLYLWTSGLGVRRIKHWEVMQHNLKTMKHLILILTTVVLLSSCEQKPKINYRSEIDTTAVIENKIKDTTKVLVSELPVKFDSTDILIYAIGLIDLEERGGYSKYASGSYSNTEIALSYFNRDYLSGDLINLVFHEKNGNERKLTDKKIQIRRVIFLREIYKKTKQGYLLYSMTDRDTNGDKEIDNSDIEALYISRIDGTRFKKITNELHEFYDYCLVNGENKVYFRTLEDKNKDGKLNNKDKFHYYFIEFTTDTYNVKEYNPLKIFE